MTDLPITDAPRGKLGPILLAPGVSARQAIFYLVVACTAIALTNFMAAIQPYVFNEMLAIPRQEQGRLVGQLAAMQQVAVLIFVPIFGVLSDRYGRRVFLMIAVCGMVASLIFYPLAATVMMLFVLRFAFGLASTAHTAGGATMLIDIPDNSSRGRFLSLLLVTQYLINTLFVNTFAVRLPGWLQTHGVDPAAAGRYTFWVMAALGGIGIVACLFGMVSDRRAGLQRTSARAQLTGLFVSMGGVLKAAKGNKRLRFLLAASVVMRADTAVVGAFLSQWVVSGGHDAGLSTADSLKVYGQIQVVNAIMHVIFPALGGLIVDRVSRTTVLIVSLVLTTLAFASAGLIHNVLGWGIYAVIVGISLAESLQSVASQSLLGQEAPAHLRGATYSLFAFIGVISVIVVNIVSGELFDRLGYAAPFILIACMSAAFLGIAAVMLRGKPDAQPA